MSNYKWVLDAGHGGMVNGHYATAPRKMCKFNDGLTIYEGVINRHVTDKLCNFLDSMAIEYVVISAEHDDLSLQLRVQKADNEYTKDDRCIFVGIHSNAGGGSGFEIFTSVGQTKSDKIAQIFCDVYKKLFPDYPFRNEKKDGDDDKEAEFYVLRKTDCPAVLVENLFFDNRKEAEYLLSEKGQADIALCLFTCIQMVEKLKPI